MSGLLDQILMEDIARNCPKQFLAFHKCMGDPQGSNCGTEQVQLAVCIKGQVPAFQKIQGECGGRLQAYEACLKNARGDTKRCEGDLKILRKCALGSVS